MVRPASAPFRPRDRAGSGAPESPVRSDASEEVGGERCNGDSVGEEVGAWAASGAMALTGRPDEPPMGPPAGLVPRLRSLGAALGELAPGLRDGLPAEPVALLGERAALSGLRRQGTMSCGGSTRLLAAADAWWALTLARPDDMDLVPALVRREVEPGSEWDAVASTARARPARDLVEDAILLGLPAALLDQHPPLPSGTHPAPADLPVGVTRLDGPPAPGAAPRSLLVADLSALWAGPLCGSVLAMAGARVLKLESTARPDGARQGTPAFFDLLNAGKASVAFDHRSGDGRRLLGEVLSRVDVVIEASRPRALEQLGIDARSLVAGGGPRVWLSITGHGRIGEAGNRVAFGDDAAVAGGLVVRDRSGPCFCADAVADPLAGLVAAAAALELAARGGRWLVDTSMAAVAAAFAGPTLPTPRDSDGAGVEAAVPRARRSRERAAPLGADTAAVRDLLGIGG